MRLIDRGVRRIALTRPRYVPNGIHTPTMIRAGAAQDIRQLAMVILGVAKGDRVESFDAETVNDLARAAGLKRGMVWAAKLSSEERSRVASQTTRVHWKLSDDSHG